MGIIEVFHWTGSPSTYKGSLGINATQDSIGLSFDSNVGSKFPPLEYFQLVSGNSSSGSSGQEWYLQLIKAIDRDVRIITSTESHTDMFRISKSMHLEVSNIFLVCLDNIFVNLLSILILFISITVDVHRLMACAGCLIIQNIASF